MSTDIWYGESGELIDLSTETIVSQYKPHLAQPGLWIDQPVPMMAISKIALEVSQNRKDSILAARGVGLPFSVCVCVCVCVVLCMLCVSAFGVNNPAATD